MVALPSTQAAAGGAIAMTEDPRGTAIGPQGVAIP